MAGRTTGTVTGSGAGRSPRGSDEVRVALPRAKTNFRSLFERAPDAILVVDREGRYVDANTAATRLLGYSRAELLRMHVGDLASPADEADSAQRFALLKKVGRTRRDRLLQRKDGSQILVEAHAVELGDGHYQTILRDVSDRVRAETELKRSLHAYATLVELCHAAVIAAGPDGRITSWNPAAEKMFGYSGEEALGMAVTRLIPTRFRRKHLASFRRVVEAAGENRPGKTIQVEGLRKDGSEVPIEASLASGRSSESPMFTAVVWDVSEHREMVEKLNDALQKLRFHIERMPLAYIVWDAGFRVVDWNPAAERIFGYPKAEAVGRHAYDLIVPSDVVPTIDVVWDELLKGDTSSHSTNSNVRKDGSRLTCEWFNTPLRDSGGSIRGVASMAMDVSAREAMEARIRHAQKIESLGILTSGIAHDFNSALTVILGNCALLRSTKGLSPRVVEHLELIEAAGDRAEELIQHLLTYSRTGRHNPQETDLNAVIRDGYKLLGSAVGPRHKLTLNLARQLAVVMADRSQVGQILLNLCQNAKEAMADGGAITITTRNVELTKDTTDRCVPGDARPGSYVELAVTDRGCGMEQATVARSFDPFFTTKLEGHGLGMAAVLGILRQHGAVASIESKLRRGTKVRVFFPVHVSKLGTGNGGSK